jgi:hypothetical protein
LSRAVFELLQVLVEVFFIGHLVACLWWGVSDAISENPWFTNVDMVYNDLTHAPVREKYLYSLYFTFTTMTTVGYGDITATNTGERILNMCIIVLGASVFGYIIANVSTILESFSRVEAAQSNRITVIKEYLNEKNCPDGLQSKVVAHFKHLFSITSAYDVTKIMSRLPPALRDEILYFHNETKMKNISIFRYIPNRSLALHIFNQLTPAFYEVDQYIIKQGRESAEINFVVIGTACAFRMDPVRFSQLFAFSNSRPVTPLYHFSNKLQPKQSSRPQATRTRQRAGLFNAFSMQDEEQYNAAKSLFLASQDKDKPDRGEGDGVDDGGDVVGGDFTPGWAPAERTAKPLRPKVSFGDMEMKNSDTVTHFDDASVGSDGPAPGAINPFPSVSPMRRGVSFAGAGMTSPGSPDTDKHEFHLPKVANLSSLNDEEKEFRGLHLIGDFGPGDFFGHASLMKDTVHECSLVATTPCTVFVLTRATIYKLIHAEPVVGLRLQEALGAAISMQAQHLGQSHRRTNRAEFLR